MKMKRIEVKKTEAKKEKAAPSIESNDAAVREAARDVMQAAKSPARRSKPRCCIAPRV